MGIEGADPMESRVAGVSLSDDVSVVGQLDGVRRNADVGILKRHLADQLAIIRVFMQSASILEGDQGVALWRHRDRQRGVAIADGPLRPETVLVDNVHQPVAVVNDVHDVTSGSGGDIVEAAKAVDEQLSLEGQGCQIVDFQLLLGGSGDVEFVVELSGSPDTLTVNE